MVLIRLSLWTSSHGSLGPEGLIREVRLVTSFQDISFC